MAKAAPVMDDSFKQRLVEAMRLHTAGKVEDAQHAYEALLKESPDQPALLKALATIYLQKQQWGKAIAALRHLLSLDPRQPDQIMRLAQAEIEAGHKWDAMQTLAKLLMVAPADEKAIDLLYELCLAETPADDIGASPLYKLIEQFPKALALNSVGIKLCRKLEDRTFRLKHLQAIIDHSKPEGDSFYIEYGAMLRDNQEFERAFKVANEALETYPDSVDLRRLRGSLYISFGQHDKALADAYHVYSLVPENHQALFAIGLIKMLTSNCTDGYKEFAGLRNRSLEVHAIDFPIPEWQGEDIAGKHLLAWANEGMGDITMYAGFLPYLLQRGVKISFAVPEKLSMLLSRSFPDVPLMPMIQQGAAEYAKRCDAWSVISQFVPHMLPHYKPAEHPPYLKADMEKAKHLRAKYQKQSPGKKLVGISWYTKNVDSASRRNIPLEEWGPLLTHKAIQLISLQYGDHKKEIGEVEKRFPGALIVDPEIDAYDDIDGLCAQMMALDEVVTIDNTTIHLAGALGIKSTLLLSAASEWRWGLKRTDCLWYKSVRVERQKDLLDWQPELEMVAKRLVD